jgi:hypothetical protein
VETLTDGEGDAAGDTEDRATFEDVEDARWEDEALLLQVPKAGLHWSPQ